MSAYGHTLSPCQSRIVYLRSLLNIPEEPVMRFRLTYEGALKSTQRDPETGQRDPLAPHKHNIRNNFHRTVFISP